MSKSNVNKVDLGYGISLLEDNSTVGGDKTVVFLDRLLLPCSLPELSVDQIKVINRYRESVMEHDDFGSRAQSSREMFLTIIQELKPLHLLEVGGGKFPISSEATWSSYCGVDVDDEAIVEMHNLGLVAHDPSTFVRLSENDYASKFDMIFGSFSFHFHFESAFIQALISSLAPSAGLMIFNFISQDCSDIFGKISFLCSNGLSLRVLKAPNFASREYLAIMATDLNLLRHDIFDRIETGRIG